MVSESGPYASVELLGLLPDDFSLNHVDHVLGYVSRVVGDPTNNVTERVIGLTYKIRAKTMRGFKNWDKVLAHPYLWQYLRGENGISDLRRVI